MSESPTACGASCTVCGPNEACVAGTCRAACATPDFLGVAQLTTNATEFADVTGDGLDDLFSAGPTNGPDSSITIRAGGALEVARNLPLTNLRTPWSIQAGLITNDTLPDFVGIAFTPTNGIALFVVPGTAVNAWGAPVIISTNSQFGVATLALADISADGRLDIIASAYDLLFVLRNTSTATPSFAAAQSMSVGTDERPRTAWGLVLGDLDGDARADLVYKLENGNLVRRLGTGSTPPFGGAVTISTAQTAEPFAIVDATGDGLADVITGAARTVAEPIDGFYVFPRTSSGAFSPPTRINLALNMHLRGVVELDGDGLPEILAWGSPTGTAPYSLMTLRSTGPLSWAAPTSVPAEPLTRLRAGSFRTSGVRDLFAQGVNGNAQVKFGAPGGVIPEPVTSPNVAGQSFAGAGDVDGDGKQDLVRINEFGTPRQGAVLRGDGAGHFTQASTLSFPGERVVVARLDDDRFADTVSWSLTAPTMEARFGSSTAALVNPVQFSTSATVVSAAIVDLDGDGRRDVIALTRAGLDLFRRTGPSSFAPRTTVALNPFDQGVTSLTVADATGDGRPDVWVGWEPSSSVYGFSLFANAGGAISATSSRSITVSNVVATSLVMGSFTSDSSLDVALATSSGVRIFNGTSQGFVFSSELTSMPSVGSLLAADVDGDGRLDLLGGAPFRLARQTSAGQFAPTLELGFGGWNIFATDVTNDGRIDLVSVGGTVLTGVGVCR